MCHSRWVGILTLVLMLIGVAAWAAPPIDLNTMCFEEAIISGDVPICLDIGAVPVALNVVAYDELGGDGSYYLNQDEDNYIQDTWTTSALCASGYMPGDAGAKIVAYCSTCFVDKHASEFTPATPSGHLQLGA